MMAGLVPPIDKRLRKLLQHLSSGKSRDLPPGVGRKTTDLAIRTGLVVLHAPDRFGWQYYELTPTGSGLLQAEDTFHRTPRASGS